MIAFNKTYPEPPELTAIRNSSSKNYRIPEVIEQVKLDFENKCYLCESKGPTTINVEHFRPHKNDRDLMLDWSNLYYSCAHCNNLKLAQYDNILDCLLPSDDIENKIHLRMDPYPQKKVEVISLANDPKTLSTSELLEKIYNGSTVIKTIEATNIKNNLLYELMQFQKLLIDYFKYENIPNEYEEIRKEIKRHLRSDSAFTGFKRCIIKEDSIYMLKFGDLLT